MSFLSKNLPRTIISASRHRTCNTKLLVPVFPPMVKTRTMADITPVFTNKVMSPVGPYSQATKTPHAIYCSGQLAADASGTLINGTITEKTAQVLANLKAVLEEAGSSLDRVVKVQIFLTDMKDFEEMNREYEKWVVNKPARSCVAVKGLPKGADLEIECVALP